jgi:hypothetical protein
MDFDDATLPATLTVEHEGKPIPLRDTPFVKEAKDLGSLIKGGYDAHREVGARVRIPAKDKADDVKAFKGKLYEAGILEAPPGNPEEYEVPKPENLPAGMSWNDDIAKEFQIVLHKHGLPKGAAKDLIDLHVKALGGQSEIFKGTEEEGRAALKAEFGEKYDGLLEDAGRLAATIFKTPEELAFYENSGLGNHPLFLGALMRLAPLARQDSSFMPDANRPAAGGSADSVRAEVADIMNNKANPRNAGYWTKEPAVMDYIQQLYEKAYGKGTVTIT